MWQCGDRTYLDLYVLLNKKGFKEVEPFYYTICDGAFNYFVYVNPLKPVMVLYVLNSNDTFTVLIKDKSVESFYNEINRHFNTHDYWESQCITTKFLKKAYRNEKIPDYHIDL